jgi:RecB family endonuclease NucS
MRLVVAHCTVDYAGRLTAHLPLAPRLVMIKADGCVAIHADGGAYKPLNWMCAPNRLIEGEGRWECTNPKGERLIITIDEVFSDVSHDFGDAPALEKDGVESQLQAALAAEPTILGEDLRLVRREWPTDVGPVDLMCRDADGGWVAVEVKRVGTIEAVEQLCRYLECIRVDPVKAACRGILAAQQLKPQAVSLATARGIRCVDVDLELLRGLREPELTLFS